MSTGWFIVLILAALVAGYFVWRWFRNRPVEPVQTPAVSYNPTPTMRPLVPRIETPVYPPDARFAHVRGRWYYHTTAANRRSCYHEAESGIQVLDPLLIALIYSVITEVGYSPLAAASAFSHEADIGAVLVDQQWMYPPELPPAAAQVRLGQTDPDEVIADQRAQMSRFPDSRPSDDEEISVQAPSLTRFDDSRPDAPVEPVQALSNEPEDEPPVTVTSRLGASSFDDEDSRRTSRFETPVYDPPSPPPPPPPPSSSYDSGSSSSSSSSSYDGGSSSSDSGSSSCSSD